MLKLNNNSIGVSWWDMSDIIKDLCDRIPLELPLVDSVYGIPRGGLIPAVMISHHLGLPYKFFKGRPISVLSDSEGIYEQSHSSLFFSQSHLGLIM